MADYKKHRDEFKAIADKSNDVEARLLRQRAERRRGFWEGRRDTISDLKREPISPLLPNETKVLLDKLEKEAVTELNGFEQLIHDMDAAIKT